MFEHIDMLRIYSDEAFDTDFKLIDEITGVNIIDELQENSSKETE